MQPWVHNDILGAAILGLLFAAVIATAELWTRRRRPDPEQPRKLVHVAGGVGTLLFPFLVRSPWTVVVMAVLFAAFFRLGERSRRLQCLGGVTRKSRGSEYYPLAVAFLFYVSQGRWWLYFTSVLILTFADAAAALIGGRFGRIRFQVGTEDRKSLEGSLAFWLVSLLVIAGLLRGMTPLPPAACLLSAFLVAALLTGIEAVSVRGTDNIFVPALTWYVLLRITSKPVAEMAFQCASLAGMALLLGLTIWWLRLFCVRDAILFVTFAYAVWSLGSVDWSLPFFVGFAAYAVARAVIRPRDGVYAIGTGAVLRVLLVPLAVLVTANAGSGVWYERLYGPFLAAGLIPLCCGTWAYMARNSVPGNRSPHGILAFALCAASLITGVTALRLDRSPWVAVPVLVVVALAGMGAYAACMRRAGATAAAEAWARPMAPLALAAAMVYFALQQAGLLALWHPDY